MSQFGAEKFTTRSREAIETAQRLATTSGHSHTEPVHLLVALLGQDDGIARSLVTKAGVDVQQLVTGAGAALEALPRASGATVQQPSASAALTRVLAGALDLASSMKDEYVATEHLLISMAGTESSAHWESLGRSLDIPLVAVQDPRSAVPDTPVPSTTSADPHPN